MPWPADRTEGFIHPRAILCEGAHDAAFLYALCEARGLPAFHVRYPLKEHGFGISGFTKALEGLTISRGFRDLQNIVIIADADESPNDQFAYLQKIIAAVPPFFGNGRYPVPDHPLIKKNGTPSISVFIVPNHLRIGNLETLCVEAAYNAQPDTGKIVDEFAATTGAARWEETKLSKMKLRSLVASTHRKNPDIGLGNIWKETGMNLIPLTDSTFDPIAEFLESFR